MDEPLVVGMTALFQRIVQELPAVATEVAQERHLDLSLTLLLVSEKTAWIVVKGKDWTGKKVNEMVKVGYDPTWSKVKLCLYRPAENLLSPRGEYIMFALVDSTATAVATRLLTNCYRHPLPEPV